MVAFSKVIAQKGGNDPNLTGNYGIFMFLYPL